MSQRPFIHDDFLLDTEPARTLYHEYAASMPILDFHCHLPPVDIAEDRRWDNLTQIWLYGDHYKWRAMRANGITERFCTGDASDREKFERWAETVPATLRNPLYHWTHLELARYFDCHDLLSPATATRIWEIGEQRLAEPGMSARGLLRRSSVAAVCTTDDPTDSLEHHRALAADASLEIPVYPTWRPDRATGVADPSSFNRWVDDLAGAANVDIKDFASYLAALHERHAFFHEVGCRASDHGVDRIDAEDYTDSEVARSFDRLRSGQPLDEVAQGRLRSALRYEFARMDAARGWVQQIHYGAARGVNSRMTARLGPDTGFDSIGDLESGRALARLLDRLDSAGELPKTIVYNVNPRDNALLVSLLGSFQDGATPGKMQHGSAWWFLDQIHGMTEQIEALSAIGLLARFVGMVTDSRSFLSYARHEYFRRLLCNLLGNDMEAGRIPSDYELVGEMVKDISFRNAAAYLGLELATSPPGP